MKPRSTLVFPLALLAVCATQQPSPRDPLREEFAGSYPATVTPSGAVRDFELVAEEAEVSLVNGKPLRVWAYNGQVPGPALRVRLGETVRARFTNRLREPTTIHWHGVRVPNDMDGVPTPTRPAIAPGETFVYEFTPKDAGTFWYHPHIRSSEQVERGLFGMLIVEDATPLGFSHEVLWVLDDWLLGEDGQIVQAFNTRHDLAHDGRWGNHITVNGHAREVLTLRPGARVRLRLVNVANGRVFKLNFGALDAQIIAVDGLYVPSKLPVSGFEIAPGNRVDVDLTAGLASGAVLSIEDRFIATRPNRIAEIRVEGDPIETPRFEAPPRVHVPEWKTGMAVPVDHALALDARTGGPFGIEWTIDGETHAGHGGSADHRGLTVGLGRFNHLKFENRTARLHPIHLHGMFFRVLARNGRPSDEAFFRDTVLVHARETVDVGIVPFDEGHWMMHCHILEHAEAGMMRMMHVGQHPLPRR